MTIGSQGKQPEIMQPQLSFPAADFTCCSLMQLLVMMLIPAIWTCLLAPCLWATALGADTQQLRIGYNNDTMRDFIAKIFENYDKTIPPSMYTGNTAIVRVSLMVHAMSSIDVIDMDYSVNMFLRQYWNDTRLAYAHRGYNQSLTLNSKKSELWVPDLYFINEKEGSFHEITTPNLLLRVNPAGQVTYSQKLTVKLSCNMDLKKFPMDQQKCYLKMESYGYTTKELMFEWVNKTKDRVQFSSDLELPEFVTPPNISTETRVVKYLTGSYSYLIATFYLNRKSGFYLIQTYIPSILIVILSWVSFWIDVRAVPARISLGLLTVLSMTTQSSGALGQLPRVSYIKAIDVWMSTCLVFVFGALIEYAIANVLARRHSSLDRWENLRSILDSGGQQTVGPASQSPTNQQQPNQSRTFRPGNGGAQASLLNQLQNCGQSKNRPETIPMGYMNRDIESTNRTVAWDGDDSDRLLQRYSAHPGAVAATSASSLPNSAAIGLRQRQTATQQQHQQNRFQSQPQPRSPYGSQDGYLEEDNVSSAEMIDRISRAAFPLSFVLFNLGYWVYYIYIAE